MGLVQLEMIEAVKNIALADDSVSAVLMYGSFIKGEGDQYSDIEFYIFFHRDFDHREFVSRVRPLLMFFQNEFGTEVAVFDNLIRGEFHFAPAAEIDLIKAWEGLTSFEYADQMSLVDKEGKLAAVLAAITRRRPKHDTAEHIRWLAESLINNLLMVGNLIQRGEAAHAQACFQFILKYLVWFIRLADAADNHWESPTKKLEQEISPAWYVKYRQCPPTIEPADLRNSLGRSVALAEELFAVLKVPDDLKKLLSRLSPVG